MARSDKTTVRHQANMLIAWAVDMSRWMLQVMDVLNADEPDKARLQQWVVALPPLLNLRHEEYTQEEIAKAQEAIAEAALSVPCVPVKAENISAATNNEHVFSDIPR